jgi:hypothetical protein
MCCIYIQFNHFFFFHFDTGFPLLPKFNKVINYMTDMGLIDKVYEDFIFNITIIRKMREMLKIDKDLDDDDLSLYDGKMMCLSFLLFIFSIVDCFQFQTATLF